MLIIDSPSTGDRLSALSHFFSPRLLYLPYESTWLISLFHLISGLFVSQPPFLFQVWLDLKWNQDPADLPEELLRAFTHSCFLLLLLGRFSLLASLSSSESAFFHCAVYHFLFMLPLWSLSLAKARLSPTLTLSPLMIWYFGLTALFSFLLTRAALVCLPIAFSVALSHSFLFSRLSLFKSSAETCAILHALCWSRQHQQVCHFFSLLLLSDSRSVLSSIFPFTSNSVADLAGTVFSLLYYQATMGPRTLVFFRERRGWWASQTGCATCALCNPL